ncbi:GNAT family N-acetyltransferase [Noviherbaspirillum aridicola]|uniref:BioF2-like acetyltransferase domain-containing protein n=1 Tax=Noviherbaspirillum aridicola TaxID=2849687 RepID=A0ABQ4Q681_9BURK|nr:GNAT family N-acetyltransferase [Noviherbaspirillum aridicola]GIZ52219.1 hypothetical protein NCCP691_22330 [Noviherbaspirillum aridicola]
MTPASTALHDRLPHAGTRGLLDLGGSALPVELDDALSRLYGNIHSTPAHLRIYGGLDEVNAVYVARDHEALSAVLLLRDDGRRLRVINEGMRLEAAALEDFARHAFAARPHLSAIEFNAVEAPPLTIGFPVQQAICTADMPLALPPDADTYLASLGKNMRRNLRRYMDRLLQLHPSFRFEILEREAISPADARAVIDLNRARIAGKQQAYSIDDEEERILALLGERGMAGIGRIDGRVCCGALGYRVGGRYFFKIIGHDPQYNPCSLGILCCYLMIRACIERGCSEFNFMWNEYEYKYALGARRRDLQRVVIYRSRLHQLAQGRLAAGLALAGARHRAAALLEPGARLDELPAGARATAHLLRTMRAVKRGLAFRRAT